MDDVTVLVTGAGAPGIMGTIYSLKNNFDKRKINIIGVDIKKDVIGKYLCKKFYQIPKPENDDFISRLLEICKKEEVEVILPQVTNELFKLSKFKQEFENIGTKVAISDYETILRSNNKFELMNICKKQNMPYPKHYLVKNFDDLIKKAKKLGYPENPIVIKPKISSGMRGLRIINKKKDFKKSFYEEKPTGIYITIDELKKILRDEFSELILMEFLPGKEYTVDIFRSEEKEVVIPRSRELIRSGITFNGTVEKNDEIIKYSKKIAEVLNMKYVFGFQFKLDNANTPKILESNPRIQGTMVLSTLAGANIIYASVKYALKEEIPDFEIKWGTRLLRYWGGVGVFDNKVVGVI